MKKMAILLIFLSLSLTLSMYDICADTQKLYGVFIGLEPENIDKLTAYKEVVIDCSYFTKEHIDYLHKNNVLVYSYLNIGSLEDFRDYYSQFEDITLDDYENWEGERWVDVSSHRWYDYILNRLARELYNKGIDGFFLDNTDVYVKYPEEKILDGLYNIIKDLKRCYGKKVILNNGSMLLHALHSRGIKISKIVDGFNKESVYTTIDFENDSFVARLPEETAEILSDLKKIKKYGLSIYITEYSSDSNKDSKLLRKYHPLRYKVYIARSIELD